MAMVFWLVEFTRNMFVGDTVRNYARSRETEPRNAGRVALDRKIKRRRRAEDAVYGKETYDLNRS